MKKRNILLVSLTGLLLKLFISNTFAALPTYNCKITGATQVSCNVFEFDVMMQRTTTCPSVTLVTDISPIEFNVTGSGSYCQGGPGLPVGLYGSEVGIVYTINPGGMIVTGTGGPITFGNQLAGTYTVWATGNGGTIPMIGAAVITETTTITPIFTQLGPYMQYTPPGILPTLSNNGIFGTWSPAVISTASFGNFVYTFTPDTGQCATGTTMIVTIVCEVPAFSGWTWMVDIGNTLKVSWPKVSPCSSVPAPPGTFYNINYRPIGSSVWISATTQLDPLGNPWAKVTNLIPGQAYEWRSRTYVGGFGPPVIGPIEIYTTANPVYGKMYDIGTTALITWEDYSPWVTSYAFQYKATTSSTWIGAVAYLPEAKVSGLMPETTYDVRVAVYMGGLWGYLQAGQFTTGKVSFTASNNSGTEVDISWNNLANDLPSWATSYAFYYKALGSPTWIGNPAGSNTFHLSGLTGGTTYECYVNVYKDGGWGPSQIGQFNTGPLKDIAITNSGINMYPNPFTDQVSLDLFTEKETSVTWTIYDMTGKAVLSGNENLTSGHSTLNIDAKELSDGVYMLNAIVNDQMQSFRIMKQ